MKPGADGPGREPVGDPGQELEILRELYEDAPCGYLTVLLDGTIVRANRTLLSWTGHGEHRRFQSLLSKPGALMFETYCVPLLRLQGFVNEVALDLVDRGGNLMPVLLCATVQRDAAGEIVHLRVVIFNAPRRREYERELVRMRKAAEDATEQVQIQRALLERKVVEQSTLLHSVGRMAGGDLETPITIEITSSLLPLASELERLRRDIVWQLQALKERNAEIQQLNRELRHQIEQRSLLLAETAVVRAAHPSAEAPGLLPSGTILAERYRLANILGQGGMATVYEVERLSDGRRYAAKVLSVRPSYQALARFAREAQFLARLQHPNLINIIDTDVTEDRVAYIIMELARGKSLAEYSARHGELDFVLPVLSQVAEALTAVHAADVVHRDLKPSNVLIIDGDGGSGVLAKLVDFGISLLLDPVAVAPERTPAAAPAPISPDARIEASRPSGPEKALPVDRARSDMQLNPLSPTVLTDLAQLGASAPPPERPATIPPGPSRRRESSDELTQVGVLLGTPSYMAPELSSGSSLAQPPSDLFSFGVLAYQVLTGKLPFDQPPLMVALVNDGKLPFEPLGRLRPGLDSTLVQAIERCLSADPAGRPTALELASTLAEALPPARGGAPRP